MARCVNAPLDIGSPSPPPPVSWSSLTEMRPDLAADLPRVRCSPLPWWFPLAFVIHGVAPGAVLFGLSLGGVIPTPWSYVGIVAGLPLMLAGGGVLVWVGLRGRARIERMREAEAGYPAWATIMAAQEGVGSFRNRRGGQVLTGKKVELTLSLSVSGWAPYTVTQESYFGTAELGALRPGAQIEVRVHPRDPQLVFVPWQRAAHPPDRRRGPSVQMTA